jgi:predicted component of type VI protein secretion system
MPPIEIINANGRRKADLAAGVTTFGRSRICQMRVNDKALSREHFEIRLKDGVYWLKDLGSRNKTFVNGLNVTEVQLKPGDRITAGRTTILFEPAPSSGDSAVAGAVQAPAAAAAGGPVATGSTVSAPPAPPAPGTPPSEASARSAAEGTAPLPVVAAEQSAAAWKSWLMVAVVLLGAMTLGLAIYLLVKP